MKVIADLQIHSKFSRAVSKKMDLYEIARWAKIKGIDIVATGDWTHPMWLNEIKLNLTERGNGLLQLKVKNEKLKVSVKNSKFENDFVDPLFFLATEVSCIYSQGGKARRIHLLIWSPSIATCQKIIRELLDRNVNLGSDGRPIMGFTAVELCDLVFSTDEKCLVIPAHAWTPWFSLYGSESGFDSLEECFGKFSRNIYAVETGLSSDPSMNWRIKELDNRSIVSFSDAHSGAKLGREATIFKIKNQNAKITPVPEQSSVRDALNRPRHADWFMGKNTDQKSKLIISYNDVAGAIKQDKNTAWEIGGTIEFYPEEGKYHYSGHRICNVKQSPDETRKKGVVCPVCRRKMTLGVAYRVEELANRSEAELKLFRDDLWVKSKTFSGRPPFVKLAPLLEIIGETLDKGVETKAVLDIYDRLISFHGGEIPILLNGDLKNIAKTAGENIASAIDHVRHGRLTIDPGFDNTFGKIKINSKAKEQLSLF